MPWVSYPEYELDPADLPHFVGTYQGQPGVPVRVKVEAGALQVETGGEWVQARPYGPASFLLEKLQQPARFLEDEPGKVWALALGLRVHPRRPSSE